MAFHGNWKAQYTHSPQYGASASPSIQSMETYSPQNNTEEDYEKSFIGLLALDHGDLIRKSVQNTRPLKNLDECTKDLPAKKIEPVVINGQVMSSTHGNLVVLVLNVDTVDAARLLKVNNRNPLLLNNANAHSPGGNQERSLMNQLALTFALNNSWGVYKRWHPTPAEKLYPIPRNGAIFTPGVPQVRTSDGRVIAPIFVTPKNASEYPNKSVGDVLEDARSITFDVLSASAVNQYAPDSSISRKKANDDNDREAEKRKLKILNHALALCEQHVFIPAMDPTTRSEWEKISPLGVFKTLCTYLDDPIQTKNLYFILTHPGMGTYQLNEWTWGKINQWFIHATGKTVINDGVVEFVAKLDKEKKEIEKSTTTTMANDKKEEEEEDEQQKRCRYVLRAAVHTGHSDLVLGAYGCGVFGNDPNKIANTFQKLLMVDEEFKNRFGLVVFAITDGGVRGYSQPTNYYYGEWIDGHYHQAKKETNFEVFNRVFTDAITITTTTNTTIIEKEKEKEKDSKLPSPLSARGVSFSLYE